MGKNERELIYKEEARRALLKADPHVIFCIDNIKPVDAVEVVRCKDCKYFNGESCSNSQWWDDDYTTWVKEEDFCSYGEKLPQITEQTKDALVKMGEKAHGDDNGFKE